jgi:enoyl-[acyl-carrier-protein] reductase (NADH)
MDTHVDLVGLAGLVVGLIALFAAIYGIRDVRQQAKVLVTLERNRVFAKVIHTMVWRVVERVVDTDFQSSSDIHEFTMLARALDPKQTLASALNYANKETLAGGRPSTG